MTRREAQAVQVLMERTRLPADAFTVLMGHGRQGLQLHLWLDRAYMSAIGDVPRSVNGVPVSIEPRPRAVAFRLSCTP